MNIMPNIEIGFQEIPDEISLIMTVCGCKYHCKNCHSPEIWDATGIPFDYSFINKYKSEITCVLFMGGENEPDLIESIKSIKDKFKLKVGLYTGAKFDDLSPELKKSLDYLKVGQYVEELGGLKNPNTNQYLLKVINLF